jgi:KTSC domain
MASPNMIAVTTSHLTAVGYDPTNQNLHVKISKNSRTYVYRGVPQEVYDSLMASPPESMGQFFRDNIHPTYNFTVPSDQEL